MRSRPRSLAALLVTFTIVASGCGGDDPVTRQQYLDHAVEFSTAAKTPEQKASMRKLFDCAWPEVSKDEELLARFMAADTSEPDLSAAMSKLLAPCVGAAAEEALSTTTTAAPPTTAPE